MRWILGSLVLIPALIGCEDDEIIDNIDDGTRELVATLRPLPGGGDMTGSSDVQWFIGDRQFIATARIERDVPGATRPWQVHVGTCAEGGAIVGPPQSYPPLVVGPNGTAAVAARVPFELDRNVSYHVDVDESAAALDTLIACGDLLLSGGGDARARADNNPGGGSGGY